MSSSKNEFPHLGEELRRFFEWTMPSAEERRLKTVRLLRGETRNREEPGTDVEPQPLELAIEKESPASNGPVEMLVEAAGRRSQRSEIIVRGLVGSTRRDGGHGETLPVDMNPSYGFPRSPVAERKQAGSAMDDGSLLAETTGADGFKADLPSSRDGHTSGRGGAWMNSGFTGVKAAFAPESLAALSRQPGPSGFTAPASEEAVLGPSGLPGRIESFTTQRAAPFEPASAYLRDLAGLDGRWPSLGTQADLRTPVDDGAWYRQANPPAIPFHEPAGIDNLRPIPPRSESRHEPSLNVSVPDAAFLSQGHAAWSTSSTVYEADGRLRSAVPERSGPGLSDLLEETRLRELLADILRTDALRHGLVLKER